MRRQILIAFALATVILAAGCLGGLLHPAAVPPAIVPVEGAAPGEVPVYTFPFGDGEETIRIEPDPAVYAGAKEADRQLYLYEDLAKEEWIPIYYLAFVNDSHQEPFYTDLLATLREIRDREELDDDRYLELIAAFVQSIPYSTDASMTEPKFPIETYVDAEGDCDDKSLLLAGLLAREGYGVALLYFGEEKHMAVGVKSAGCRYRNTTYAYIETTNRSYVGIPPAALADGTILSSDPLVIQVGDGDGLYAACEEIKTIERALSASRDRVDELEEELTVRTRELEADRKALTALDSKMADLFRSGKTGEYNRLVTEYNRMAGDYNEAIDAYNVMLDEAEAAVNLHNHLVGNAHDRPGSYLRAREYLTG
ncbi:MULTISPECIES: hypothetical protein [Methanoculleus]|uniref:Transglutaminase-like domain-containing protein n=2 Tax=Methanoculleus TaxID=45989 RepID=A3CXP5_METMJ|nr:MULTISPECIES: hypothetical protein [Methanoculleus]ABN58145.1 hypothetical protein Memar_2222 [Methanoculleus marisnigri JR1]UYU19526.1 hypothetical protein OH143_05390 [Methanoculleus submarinus]